MKNTIILTLILILFSSFTFAFSYYDLKYVIDEESYFTVNIDAYYYNYTNDYLDLNLSRDDTKLFLRGIKNYEQMSNIYINPNSDYDTSAVTINNIELDDATIYLVKNKDKTVNKILHSENGYNFTVNYNTNITQNSSHVWFDVEHFSSWTSAMDDIYVYYDILDSSGDIERAIIYVEDDYADIDSTDCLVWTGYDGDSGFDVSLSSCGGANVNLDYYDDDYGTAVYNLQILSEVIYLTVTDNWAENIQESFSDYDRNTPYRLEIYDSTLTTLEAHSGYTDLRIKEFNRPDATTKSATNIDIDEATLNCNIDRDDLENLQYYTDYYDPSAGAEYVDFKYREVGSSTWIESDYYDDPSDGEDVAIDITSLDDGVQYEYYCQYHYIDITGETDEESIQQGSTFYFTTLSTEPTSTTLNPITGDGQVNFKAIVDFKDYTGSDVGLAFYYKKVGDASYTRAPASGWEAPTDDIVFTSSAETGLTNGDTYTYYSYITWDSGSETYTGNSVTFIPSAGGSSSEFSDDLYIWLDVDEDDDTVRDYADVFTIGTDNSDVQTSDSTIYFDGVDNYISYNDDNALSFLASTSVDKAISFCTWIEFTDSTNYIFRKFDYSAKEYQFYQSSGYFYAMFWQSGSVGIAKKTDSTLLINTLYHVCVVYDGSESSSGIDIYVDGTTPTQSTLNYGTYTGMVNGVNPVVIGSSNTGTYSEYNLNSLALWNKELTSSDILSLYQEGAEFNPYVTVETSTIIPELLSVTNLAYSSVTLNSVSSFNESAYTVYGGYNWRINGSSTWINNSFSEPELSDGETNSLSLSQLEHSTIYEYQTYIYYTEDSETVYSFSELDYFTTQNSPQPDITTLSAVNVSSSSAILRGQIISLYGWDYVNSYFLLSENGEEYDVLGLTNTNETGIYTLQLDNLTQLYNYTYKFLVDYTSGYNVTVSSESVDFNTPEYGAPIINTKEATSILRHSANLNCEIVSFGVNTDIDIYFYYHNATFNNTVYAGKYSNLFSPFYNVDNLSINSSYEYYCFGEYSTSGVVYGGNINFTTLTLLDFVNPQISKEDETNVLSSSVTTNIYIDLRDLNNVSYKVFLETFSGSQINSTDLLNANSSGFYSYNFAGLNPETRYCYYGTLYFNNGTDDITISSGEECFTTISEVENPKYVSIIPLEYSANNKNKIFVQNPLLFTLIFIIATSIIGCGFVLYDSYSSMGYGKIYIYVTLGLVLFEVIWCFLNVLLNTWVMNIMLIGAIIIGTYFMFLNEKGGIYG